MTSSPSHFDAAAEDQAALWAARLEGSTLPAEDRLALDAWLAVNPAHRALLSSYCQFSADLEQQLPALVEAGLVAMPEKERVRRAWKFSWIASGALATAAAAFVVWLAWPATPIGKFATPVAQRQSLTLADGTKVELNARTNLLVLKSGTERRVRLVEGEAFFQVSKDKTHPFIVETPAGSVRVTGTKFDVRSETSSELEVTVAEGSVQVRPSEATGASSAEPVALLAGDQFSVSSAGASKHALSDDALRNALAWRDGMIVLDGMPLRAAAAYFARYHGRTIVVTTGAAGLKVGGAHNLDDLDGFLEDVQKTDPVHVNRAANGDIRITLSNEP